MKTSVSVVELCFCLIGAPIAFLRLKEVNGFDLLDCNFRFGGRGIVDLVGIRRGADCRDEDGGGTTTTDSVESEASLSDDASTR